MRFSSHSTRQVKKIMEHCFNIIDHKNGAAHTSAHSIPSQVMIMSKKIAVIGECMIELSEKNAAVNRGFGGDTLNTSVYIARQTDASALAVHYVTALGTDGFSQQMLDAWQQENVHTNLIQRMADRLPGLYYIETDDTGERTFYYWRNEAAAKFWLESEQAAAICEELATFDYLYLSGISLAILSPTSRDKLLTLLRECRANGGKVIFDNNYRPRLWASQEETRQVYQHAGLHRYRLPDAG
jgi:2-dehydro-3-deoxygluconokinase